MNGQTNFLIISYLFLQSDKVGSKRFQFLSKNFVNRGHCVFILTKSGNTDRYSKSFNNERLKIFGTKSILDYPYKKKYKLGKILDFFINTFMPVDSYLGWIFPATIKGISILRNNTIKSIIVTGPPFSQFLVAYFLSLFFKKDLVLDYRDPWTLYKRYKRNVFNIFFNKNIEKHILNKAKKIIFTANLAKEKYSEIFNFIKDKSYVVHNGLEINNNDKIVLEQDKIEILYAGNFYGERRLYYLFKPLQRIFEEGSIDKNKIKFHIFGKIKNEDLILLKTYKFQNMIVHHEPVNHMKLIQFMKGVDILYLVQGNDVNLSIPFKLYDYLSVKKPILALSAKDSAVEEIINQLDCGEFANIYDESSIYFSLKKMLLNENKYSFKNIEKFYWDTISSQYLNILT